MGKTFVRRQDLKQEFKVARRAARLDPDRNLQSLRREFNRTVRINRDDQDLE